jgi:hypothetical protein
MGVVLRLTGEQHALLKAHLYPGDGNEAAAVILCGRRAGDSRHCLTARQVIPIPYDQCGTRTPVRVTWSTDVLLPHLTEAAKRGLAIVKVHSHPGGLEKFSEWDDASDRDLFASVYGWMDTEHPHASAIMLPDSRIFGRVVTPTGEFEPLSMVSVVGDELRFWFPTERVTGVREFARRHAQAFGTGTAAILSKLTIAVIGGSGTGSPVIEQLARLGVGRLILVDPDGVEEKNLNRILNATMDDARSGEFKVEMLARAIRRMGLGTEVVTFARNLFDPGVVRAVAEADIVVGCMDSVDGRFLLNKLATFYVLPYFDVGVKLEADGHGGVEQICGTVHYLQPGRSSLLSRGMFTMEQVRADGLRRTDPAAYREQLRSKYIVGAQEERPAVISVNMLFAALAVNELLARLHPYRDDGNSDFASYGFSLTQAWLYHEPEGEPCRILSRHVGRGDVRPLLDMAELSDEGTRKAA